MSRRSESRKSCMTPLVILILLAFSTVISAQELREMQYEEIPTRVIPDGSYEGKSVLVVETTLSKLSFESTRGINPGSVVEKEPGIWWVTMKPGVQLISIGADGFLPLKEIRHNFANRQAWAIKVTPIGGIPEGKGNIRIETDPSGASVTFNSIPLPDRTPFTLNDQLSGTHNLKIELDGYAPIETEVSIKKDETVTSRFTLKKEYAGLKVTSDPSGADVFLDGDNLGTTPLDRSDLSPGDVTLIVSKSGFEANTQQVRLKTEQVKEINVDLFKQTGSLEVTVSHSGAAIFLNAERIGTYTGNPIKSEKLALGNYTLKAVLDGYDDAIESVVIEYNKTAVVKLNLKGKPGSLFVMTTPQGASIYLDGRSTGEKSPKKIEGVSSGEHDLSLRLQDYGELNRKVLIDPGKTTSISETLKEQPQVSPGVAVLTGEAKQSGPLPGMVFVEIPGGSFQMGSNDGDNDEKPIHRVTVSGFEMMTTEVTQSIWVAIMGSNPSNWKGDNLPVEQVSWTDCQDFLKKLNQRDPGNNYRLPTEAEWEYACRAGTTTRFSSGSSDSDLDRVGWYDVNSGSKTHPVGQKQPNAWGLYDMHGNVWEWCSDWYGAYSSGSVTDPRGPSSGSSRVYRGGSWGGDARGCLSADRDYYVPSFRIYNLGFRLVRSL